MRLVWTAMGWGAVGLGSLGAFLPLLPTVPFLLLAAFCFARGSSRFHGWLLAHPRFGPPIRDWQAHGAISKPAKRMAVAAILASLLIPLAIGSPVWILAVQVPVLACVLAFILTRPSAPR
ncbi:YbaN family protein [Rhodobacteraceae bacterium NNCM2]|nr:YbaN family protein [Coraliihabitans acroporae]